MHLHDKSFNLPRHKIEKFENLCQQIFHINNFEQLCQFFWGGEGRRREGLIHKLGIHGLSGYTRGSGGKSLSIIYAKRRASTNTHIPAYVYIMFNDELTIAMVMVIRYYGNDPFHGNSSTRWKEDVEPVVT